MWNSPFSIIIVCAQAYCIYHVLRNRKPWWWILFIIFVPMLGCLWYFFREIQGGGSCGRTNVPKLKLLNQNPRRVTPNARLIRALEQELEYADTVDTRSKLAEAHYELGNIDESIEYFESCLKGVHRDDPALLFGLAQAHLANNDAQHALDCLITLNELKKNDYVNDRKLIEAQCLAMLDRNEEAKETYEGVYRRLSGEEARCRYALHLQQMGEPAEATRLFQQIIENCKRSDSLYRRRNKDWLSIATSELKQQS